MAQYLSTLGKITVTQVGSKAQRDFSSFYSEKPAVFVFIRRFGCGICRWSAKVSIQSVIKFIKIKELKFRETVSDKTFYYGG